LKRGKLKYTLKIAGFNWCVLKGHFQNYLQKGYYPFVFEDEETYYERMLR